MDTIVANTSIHTHDGDVKAAVLEGILPERKTLEIRVGGMYVHIYFTSLIQLQEFDESCHGAIQEALYQSAVGESQDDADQAEREAAESAADDAAEITAEMDAVLPEQEGD